MTSARRGAAFPWLAVVALLAVALTLRAPILSVTPVLRDIARDYEVDAAAVSLLTTLPAVAFAAVTPVAALVIRRAGAELAVLGCLIAVCAGTLLRLVPGFGWMLAGAVVMGVGITVGNVALPVVVRRDVPPAHVAGVTAGYAAMINVGSLVVTLGTAPLAEATGWAAAVVSWIWITAIGLVLWLLHMRRTRVRGRALAERYAGDAGRPFPAEDVVVTGPVPQVTRAAAARSGVVWLLAIAFACQSGGYFALSTWLPTLIADTTGSSASAAGAVASLFQGVGIVGALLVPVLAQRLPIAVPGAIVSVCWLGVSTGLLLAPEHYAAWTAVGGLAHGGGFVVIMTVLVKHARSDADAATGSAIVQGIGYIAAALAGPAMGAVNDATGGWTAPLAMTLALAVGFAGAVGAAIALSRR